MKKLAAYIEVKREKGALVVNAMGRTPKGKKFVKGQKKLATKSMADKEFKADLAAAVKELLGSDE